MTRRVPLVPTILVLVAVGIMIALGFWQLQRRDEKAALLAHYAEAQALSSEVPWPATPAVAEAMLYRHARLLCARVTGRGSIAGRNSRGEAGVAQTADCVLPDGTTAMVVLGWSREPVAGEGWDGGEVRGTIAPGPRLVAMPPLAGLEQIAAPDPSEIPNNHLAYAVQWFLFAATALVIYAIAVRVRMTRPPA